SASFGSGLAKSATAAAGSDAKPKTALESALEEFQKVASETPMERIRDQVLKQHGLTKDQYDALPKDKKDAIDKEIADAIKQMLTQDPDHKGRNVDKLA